MAPKFAGIANVQNRMAPAGAVTVVSGPINTTRSVVKSVRRLALVLLCQLSNTQNEGFLKVRLTVFGQNQPLR